MHYEDNDDVRKHILESYDEMPTRLEMAVLLFTGQARVESITSVHARSVRIPTLENITIEALSQYSSLSVNKVITQLLTVALDEVFQAMTSEEREAIFSIRGKLLAGAVIDKDGYVRKDLEQSAQGEI